MAKFANKNLFIVAGIVAIVGAVLLFKSFAATSTTPVEAEQGTPSTTDIVKTGDATASGGSYLKFGTTTTGGGSNVTLPARAAFYYPWFPETWSVGGVQVAYHPDLGYYNSSTQSVMDKHIQALDYGKIKVAISSWWGQGTHSETTRIPLALNRTKALNSNLKWAMYYEKEGSANPSVAELQSDLSYIKANYASSSAYANVNGKPVIFVYSANDTTCEVADRWAQANATTGFYVVLKLFSGFQNCTNQPGSWHQYGPSSNTLTHAGYYYAISPGYWQANETTPRLARDPNRWTNDIKSMVSSNAPWQLVTSFNEWGEGHAVESATEWSSSSGYGVYLDALHNN